MGARAAAPRRRASHQCVYGVVPAAAILMVDAIALIVPAQESCSHELGAGTADITFAGGSNAHAHFLGDRTLCILCIAQEHSVSDEISIDAVGKATLREPRWAIGARASQSQSRNETGLFSGLIQGSALPSGPATWAIRLSSRKA